ncbi:porin [Panacibacter sp. DH6]|uniref:Porin n=1 Tax=Panacibacter microcysteis TaxID=2793269 RepID=A0A931E432_9BACT|nr:porin [Panacibacter microcysteis]MBG9377265.1 porin [Panacibacter microcysteis]
MKSLLITAVTTAISASVFAQDSTKTNPLTISGYTEVYYSYDFNKPVNNTGAGFLYSYNRNNEINLNIGFIKAAYNTESVRANLALAAGTYVNANYAAEQGVLKNIYEANAGIKLSKKSELWLDAGIFSSHIGFESAVGKDCPTLTRSLLAENSPYFETGAKLGYTSPDSKWFLSALLLNGWQRIQRVDGNTTPAFGTQVTYKPSEKVTLNYSTFAGNDKPDSVKQMRYFQNFYGIFRLSGKIGITAGFDYGMEQQAKGTSEMNHWYSPVIIVSIVPNEKNAIALRGEYYRDVNGVIVPSNTPNGFRTFGWSINYDRKLLENALWRIELRSLHGKDNYFIKQNNEVTNNSLFLTTSLCVGF